MVRLQVGSKGREQWNLLHFMTAIYRQVPSQTTSWPEFTPLNYCIHVLLSVFCLYFSNGCLAVFSQKLVVSLAFQYLLNPSSLPCCFTNDYNIPRIMYNSNSRGPAYFYAHTRLFHPLPRDVEAVDLSKDQSEI